MFIFQIDTLLSSEQFDAVTDSYYTSSVIENIYNPESFRLAVFLNADCLILPHWSPNLARYSSIATKWNKILIPLHNHLVFGQLFADRQLFDILYGTNEKVPIEMRISVMLYIVIVQHLSIIRCPATFKTNCLTLTKRSSL